MAISIARWEVIVLIYSISYGMYSFSSAATMQRVLVFSHVLLILAILKLYSWNHIGLNSLTHNATINKIQE